MRSEGREAKVLRSQRMDMITSSGNLLKQSAATGGGFADVRGFFLREVSQDFCSLLTLTAELGVGAPRACIAEYPIRIR